MCRGKPYALDRRSALSDEQHSVTYGRGARGLGSHAACQVDDNLLAWLILMAERKRAVQGPGGAVWFILDVTCAAKI